MKITLPSTADQNKDTQTLSDIWSPTFSLTFQSSLPRKEHQFKADSLSGKILLGEGEKYWSLGDNIGTYRSLSSVLSTLSLNANFTPLPGTMT